MKAYQISTPGAATELKLVETKLPPMGENGILVKNLLFTINHCDILKRKGIHKTKLPAILGYEAIGEIQKVGSQVKGQGFEPGGLVVYCTAPGGGYAEYNVVHQDQCITVETGDIEMLASCFSKAITAHYLLRRTIKTRPGQYILVHGAAGGLGHILIQVAKFYQLNVIATVLNDTQAAFVKSLGCKHIINNSTQDFVQECLKLTDNIGVDIVYDLLGGEYLNKSMKCLNYFGLLASCGDILGRPLKLNLTLADEKCLFLTRPRLEVYKAPRLELILSANEVFTMLDKKVIKPGAIRYEFNQVPEVHQLMENFETLGSQFVRI
ncbi:zinc-binding dehydrogenase [Rickettsiales endosymbiont of Stachyamoeba lipophora]|uniref:zinc-binding dehydrogenase n=1 Tax=Rickettsiales endosymbiont of Stachyamoeba lipophora TaxID=2486578 RepID=UPI000F6482EC|nr:zinc-binding dehydrogenase [Rickettsiales endosymbiont of Stachyamoeba lipophora]AZL16046.1 hypothetical protein EF513_05800 [Rickettsiales endosymbiont of Stachyamoeba lipophora]